MVVPGFNFWHTYFQHRAHGGHQKAVEDSGKQRNGSKRITALAHLKSANQGGHKT
jgi:hypothetical protein